MRTTYYRFPELDRKTMLNMAITYGLDIYLENGDIGHADSWAGIQNAPCKIVGVEPCMTCKVSIAKELLKRYGGEAWTEHYDRDGGLFETTPICLTGNNSRFKYNQHL